MNSQHQHLVLQTEELADAAAAWLGERVELVRCDVSDPRFEELLQRAAGLVVRTYTCVDEPLLQRAQQLRVVGRAGVGLDNIDLDACQKRGITVVSTPDANTQAVVEFVISVVMDVLRPRPVITEPLPLDRWREYRNAAAGRQLSDATFGILGLGRIGRRLASTLAGLGCEVIYNDLLDIPPDQRAGAEPVSVDALFSRSDIISVHIDGRAENINFVNSQLLTLMKSDVVFINASRGRNVHTADLAAAMLARPQARALIDVHDPEPFDESYPLLGLANVRLYPHIAGRTYTALETMSWVVRDVAAVLAANIDDAPPR